MCGTQKLMRWLATQYASYDEFSFWRTETRRDHSKLLDKVDYLQHQVNSLSAKIGPSSPCCTPTRIIDELQSPGIMSRSPRPSERMARGLPQAPKETGRYRGRNWSHASRIVMIRLRRQKICLVGCLQAPSLLGHCLKDLTQLDWHEAQSLHVHPLKRARTFGVQQARSLQEHWPVDPSKFGKDMPLNGTRP